MYKYRYSYSGRQTGVESSENKSQVIEWLLEAEDVSVRYRTLSELLEHGPNDKEMKEAKAAIPGSPAVTTLFEAMRPDGSWKYNYGHNTSRYLFFVMTSLSWAAELGLDGNDERISKAIHHLFSLQREDGDFYRHYSCYNGLILRILNRMGFGDDSHTKLLRNLLLRSSLHDGGFHCDIRPKHKGDGMLHKSCIRGSMVVSLAFAEDKILCRSEQAGQLTDYFMRRHVFFRTDDLTKPVLKREMRLSFPFIYRPGLIEPVYALSKLGCGDREEMKEAWLLLESKRHVDGRLLLERTAVWPHIRHTPRGQPDKWLTLYFYLAEKARERTRNS